MFTAYKLFRVRKDGTLGSLFINRERRLEEGLWLVAEDFPTHGFKRRFGWHALPYPMAAHLSKKGRRWYEVELSLVDTERRCMRQGGLWFTAKWMRIIGPARRK